MYIMLFTERRSPAPSGGPHGTYEIIKYEWVPVERKSFFLVPVQLYMPWITHVVCGFQLDQLIFHVKSLTVHCEIVQLKAVENTQWERLHVCDVTLAATGVDKTDYLPIDISETLHMPRIIMVITSRLSSAWKKVKWSEAERSPCLYQSSKCGWWRISFALRAAKSCSSLSGLTQNLTLTNFFAINCSFLCRKNNNLNPQTIV